jgi:hypothetical protein
MLKEKNEGGIRMSRVKWNRILMQIFLSAIISISLTGCTTGTISKIIVPPEETQLTEGGNKTEIALYYDFKDVPVPKGLKIKREKSFVFQTTEFSIGFLTFTGKMESDSIMDYFTDKMPEDGWHFLSSFKSPKNIMFFLKENRFCIITITSKTRAANVEILVTPSFKGIP